MLQRLQDQDRQLADLEKELSEATHTITTLTDRLEGEGQVGVVRELEVKVQSLKRELAMESERRKMVSGSHPKYIYKCYGQSWSYGDWSSLGTVHIVHVLVIIVSASVLVTAVCVLILYSVWCDPVLCVGGSSPIVFRLCVFVCGCDLVCGVPPAV